MFGLGSICASVWTGLQDVLAGEILNWITSVLEGFFPVA